MLQFDPLDQCVDEQTDHLFHPFQFGRPSGHNKSECQVMSSCVFWQENTPGRMQQNIHCNPIILYKPLNW